MTTKLATPKGLLSPSGVQLGTTNGIEITQDQVNTFADAIGDRQCIHVDPQRANVGPFGGTVTASPSTISALPLSEFAER